MTRSVDVAVIGAGPYGLSLAAHLRSRKVDFRIFGVPMGSWKENMPQGMLLKSYPWASNLSEPDSQFTVKKFCADRGIFYHDLLTPLPVETFISYGEAFHDRFTRDVEPKFLVSLNPEASGFCARFDDGEVVYARRVVVATGLSAFRYMPPVAVGLPGELVSHSADYGPLEGLDGREVAVVGSGSSATDLSALLHERGVSVSLVARARGLSFAGTPRPRGLLQRAIAPTSGIGNGWTMGACASAPWLVHLLPPDLRTQLANAASLGPLGGAFMKDRVIGKIPRWLGCELDKVGVAGGKVELGLTSADGTKQVLPVDHVIFATGYRADVGRLGFLAPGTRGAGEEDRGGAAALATLRVVNTGAALHRPGRGQQLWPGLSLCVWDLPPRGTSGGLSARSARQSSQPRRQATNHRIAGAAMNALVKEAPRPSGSWFVDPVARPGFLGSRGPVLTLPRVSFIIPTLNEAKNLPCLLPRIPAWAYEVIIVDGRSTDGTVEVARGLCPDARIVMEPRAGKGAALQAGFKAAAGDIIIMLDADGSMAPEEAILFVGALMSGADLVKGSRFLQGAGSDDISVSRLLGNWGLTQIVRWLYGCSFSDLCYGYVAFWTRHVDALNCDCDGFEIETLINVRALKSRLKIVEVASFETPRINGVSNLRAIPDGIRVLKTILRERLGSYMPAADYGSP